jgi:hypothetical protein
VKSAPKISSFIYAPLSIEHARDLVQALTQAIAAAELLTLEQAQPLRVGYDASARKADE